METEIESAVGVGELVGQSAMLKRVRRIEGQIRGIERMISADEYCIDVLTQISAATSALKSLSLTLVRNHMSRCVVEAARTSDEEAIEKIDEVLAVLKRLVK